MKPENVLRLLLVLPYLALAIIFALYPLEQKLIGNTSEPMSLLATAALAFAIVGMTYMVGAYFWAIPYTILVAGLLLWSRGRSFPSIFRLYLWSPLLLSLLILVELPLVPLFTHPDPSTSVPLWPALVFVPLLSIPFGYVFVGIGLVILRLLGIGSLWSADTTPPGPNDGQAP